MAQTITITAPSAPVVVQEGDDFATDVLHNPWDFNERRDMGWESSFAGDSIVVANGIWSAENVRGGIGNPSGHVMPLFPGINGHYPVEPLPGDKTLPRFGMKHRIDTAKYNFLSYRLRHSDRSLYVVSWESDDTRQEWWPDPNSPMGIADDRFNHMTYEYLIQDWNIYSFPLDKLPEVFSTVQGAWTGQVYALWLEPSLNAAEGAVVEYDWIRLVDHDSAPDVTISWNTSNINSFSVFKVWVDTDAVGYDGTPVARYTDGDSIGSHSFPTAMLPPGTYHFYVTAQEASVGFFFGPVYHSGYSPPLVINAKPEAYFVSPSQISGEDYAQTVLRNPWNMDGASDVANLSYDYWPHGSRGLANEQFVASGEAEEGGTFLRAQTVSAPSHIAPAAQHGCIQLPLAPSHPIDPGKYRFLAYRIRVDDSAHPTIDEKVEHGWFSSPSFGNDFDTGDFGVGSGSIIYEDWHTYTIDLWETDYPTGRSWTSFFRLAHLQLELLETDVPTWFFVDWVKLTSENRAVNGQFAVTFEIEDADSTTFSATLYYDTDQQGFDGTQIATLNNLGAGRHSYNWDTSAFSPGERYYLYLVVNDGINVSRVYSPVQVVMGPYVPVIRRSPMDYDGDGKSDQTLYRPSNGDFYQKRSGSGMVGVRWVAGDQFFPVRGDFDGDGVADLGLIFEYYGYLAWYIHHSASNTVYARIWGLPGDQIAIADYNGNGRQEIAVFREGVWYILDENDGAHVRHWGLPGDVPVPRDYDRDGVADFAIWRPADGMWWVLNSGFDSGTTSEPYTAAQWGLPGDVPLPADWTGDGRVDLCVYRPLLGLWFIRDLQTGQVTTQQWGLPGDIPLVGDYNGDGLTDFTVFRPSLGKWFHHYRNHLWEVVQMGLPGDRLPINAPLAPSPE